MIACRAGSEVAKRQIRLPPVKKQIDDADAGRFDDHVDDYLPESLYAGESAVPASVPRAARRRTAIRPVDSRLRVPTR
jgi:hypothetical protein